MGQFLRELHKPRSRTNLANKRTHTHVCTNPLTPLLTRSHPCPHYSPLSPTPPSSTHTPKLAHTQTHTLTHPHVQFTHTSSALTHMCSAHTHVQCAHTCSALTHMCSACTHVQCAHTRAVPTHTCSAQTQVNSPTHSCISQHCPGVLVPRNTVCTFQKVPLHPT